MSHFEQLEESCQYLYDAKLNSTLAERDTFNELEHFEPQEMLVGIGQHALYLTLH